MEIASFIGRQRSKYPNHLMNRKVMFIYNPELTADCNQDKVR
jgi:hypothetical protein